MREYIEKVQSVPERPQLPTPNDTEYQARTLRWAGYRVSDATAERDLPALVAATTDLLFSAYGMLWFLGVDPDAAFEELHRAYTENRPVDMKDLIERRTMAYALKQTQALDARQRYFLFEEEMESAGSHE